MTPFDRRRFLQTGALAATLLPTRLAAAPMGDPDLLVALRDPPLASRPQIRWWWPGATVDPVTIRTEAAAIAGAGFGGFEIADVRDSVTAPIDPRTRGWASPAWIAAVEAALEEAVRLGIAPSLTLGPHWPTGVPGIRPDDDAASKELVHGMAAVGGGKRYSGPVPGPVQPHPSGALDGANPHPPVTPVLLAVQALRLDPDAGSGPPQLDPGSLIDLTAKVHGGRLDWHAPQGGEWLLLSFWMRGTGQIQNMFGMNRSASMLADPVPYVLDIYGPAAVAALTGYWEHHLLTPRTRVLLRQAGGTFFEDSLELSFACPWTPTILAAFEERRGYALAPFLALLVSRQPGFEDAIAGGGRPHLFRFKNVDAARVRHDFNSLLSEMYVENRLKPLARWAEAQGMKFRVQAIGNEIDAGLAAASAPIPEGDNSNDIHGWRRLAAGKDIGGGTILSDEAATFVGGNAHVATWRDALTMIQRDMAGGANQIVLHGFSHATAPGAAWPGFSAFGRAIGNDWGPRDPSWTMAPSVTAYLGRLQHLLRQGRTWADLAVLGQALKSQAVLRAGYTFQYPQPELLLLPQMTMRGGRLMPDGPDYRALVLNGLEEIELPVLQHIRDLAKAEFPIVIVGDPPARQRGWHRAAENDQRIAALAAELLAMPNVRSVNRQAEVVAALAALGVSSRIGFSAPGRILALTRETADGQLFYLLNDSPERVNQLVTLRVAGIPHCIDLWDGDLFQPAGWRPTDQGIAVPIDLAAAAATVVLVAPAALAGAAKRNTDNGPSLALGPWEVEFDSWLPGPSPSETRHLVESLRLERLLPWSELPGRQGMAGTARYRTSLRVPSGTDPATAVLNLGKLGGTASVAVNGSPARMVDPFTLTARIGAWLRPGRNQIEVTVASPLNNRLLAAGIAEQGFKPPATAAGAASLPPLPAPKAPDDPDLIDGPGGMSGMQPGAAPPGGERSYRDYGLIGPVTIGF